MLSRHLGLRRRPLPVRPRPCDPDGDGEGTWIEHPSFYGRVSYTWRPPVIEDPTERCPSEECLFGREWIPCKKRIGHKGIHPPQLRNLGLGGRRRAGRRDEANCRGRRDPGVLA